METGNKRRVLGRVTRPIGLVILVIVATGLTGCPSAAPPSTTGFAETEFVPVAADTTVEAPLGAGAQSLADSTWAIHKAEDDSLLFRIVFGPEGQVERLFDSFVLAQPWLGSEVIADAQARPTVFAGGSYLFGAYTAELGDNVGVLGVIHGVLLGTHLGTAKVSFSGAMDDDRIDGRIVRKIEVFADTPFQAPGDAEFDAYALREQ